MRRLEVFRRIKCLQHHLVRHAGAAADAADAAGAEADATDVDASE